MRINSISPVFRANRMSKTQAKYLADELQKEKSVDIICHETTDRDGATSAITMYDWLNSKGVGARIILSQDVSSLKLQNTDYNIIQAGDLKASDKAKSVLCVDFSKKDRVPKNVLSHIQKAKKVFCLDHHKDPDIVESGFLNITSPLNNAHAIETKVPVYVDSSAKSATSVIYRFFEALGEDYDDETAYNLFYGFADDCVKRGLLRCNGKQGLIAETPELQKDKNAREIYVALKNRLNRKQIKTIARNIDILSSLSPEEQEFKNSLIKRLKLSPNKKVAYVEIPPYDKQWTNLGCDNTRTSTILNRFRQDVLNNKFKRNDLEQVQAVFVFYRAANKYRISAHAKNDTLLDYFKYVNDNKIENFLSQAGGHPSRGGGRLMTTKSKECHKWVEDIVSCSDFYD